MQTIGGLKMEAREYASALWDDRIHARNKLAVWELGLR